MSKRSKSQIKNSSLVQIFSQLVEMKFKPQNQNGTQSLKKRKLKSKDQYVNTYDPVSMVLYANREIQEQQSRRLRFIVNLSADHFIIGNQNQIDMISFGGISHGFVDTEYFWSLRLKGPIQNIIIDSKKSVFFILSENTIYFYQYNLKNKQQPSSFANMSIKEGVRYIRILKEGFLGLFYSNYYEFYNIENLNLIKKKLQKNYPVGATKTLYYIPPSIDNIINVFFQEPKENKQSFILWCLQINFEGEKIYMKQLFRVYDVMNYSKNKLSIYNFTKDIIVMNLKNQIMAVKNGYLIDTVVMSVNQEGEVLKYIHPSMILHITKKNVQVYNFSINMTVKPERIILKSVDSISINNIPADAFYLTMLQTSNNHLSIFFEDSKKKKYQTKGQITYYFKISQSISLREKISSIFDGITSYISQPEIVDQKYNMAKKMGLNQKEIYLQIWNRSNRNSIQDYQFILSTKDYKIIKNQIQNKLKKEAMVFRQLLRIQESCFDIYKQKIEKQGCIEGDFQDFATAFLLLKKYKLFKELAYVQRNTLIYSQEAQGLEGGSSRTLKMDIQQYYFYKNMDIKAFLIENISDMLFNLKDNAKSIRIIIKTFKFVYRLIYKQIIEEIIIASKQELIHLLEQIPQILPFLHSDLNDQQLSQNLYDGIWGQIKPEEWQNQIIIENISNVYNKQVLKDFVNSIWFKRYWLTSHNLSNSSKQQIIQINRQNNSEKLFYFFISKLYQHFKHNKAYYYEVISFLQQRYKFFPEHLMNKTLLYENLYNYYYNEEKNNPKRLNFQSFLQYDDDRLFFYFFDHEKSKKNSLLRQIKPIYEQSDRNGLGSNIFNIGLFNYFYSDLSKISDLKFILNRINNEKEEFHRKNFGIHEVLVKSIQIKLYLGSDHDIPIDQVYIYIKNIPIYKKQNASALQVMNELQIMQNIKNEATRFQQMKINMNLKGIMDQCELVLNKIFQHELNKRNISNLNDYNTFKQNSISLLYEVKELKNKIYPQNSSNILIVLFLSNILKHQNVIDKVAHLLQDEAFHNIQDYLINQKIIQNIVLYLYKWKFSQNAEFKANYQYLHKIMDLLPSDNQCRIFLQNLLELAILLDSQDNPIQSYLSQTSVCPTIKDIHQLLKQMTDKQLLNLDIDKLYHYLNKLQTIAYKDSPQQKHLTSLHKIHQIVIIQLLNHNLFKQVIPYIFNILNLQPPVQHLGIIYVIIFIFRISQELNQESRKAILSLIAFYFYQPIQLLKVIDHSIKTKLTGLQHTNYIKSILKEATKTKLNFNTNNPIMSKFFCKSADNINSKFVIEEFRHHFKTKKQQLQRRIQYDIFYTILCFQPYFLSKFIDIEMYSLNLKIVKGYLTMLASKHIFHPVRMFEILKRNFSIISMNKKQNIEINDLIVKFMEQNIEEQYIPAKFNRAQGINSKIYKGVKYFAKHYKKTKDIYNSQQKEKIKQERLSALHLMLENPSIINQQPLILEESDIQKYQEKIYLKPSRRQKIGPISFNVVNQRNTILKRTMPFRQFISGKQFLILNKVQPKQQIQQIVELHPKKAKSNHLQIRKGMVERLYSHQMLNTTDLNEDSYDKRQDEEDQKFLDTFVHNQMRKSRDSGTQEPLKKVASQLNKQLIDQGVYLENKAIQNEFQTNIDIHKPKNNNVLLKKGSLNSKNQILSVNMNRQSKQPKAVFKQQISSLKQQLMKSYNESKIPKFQLGPLIEYLKQFYESPNESEDQQYSTKILQKQKFFLLLIHCLYHEPIQTIQIALKLIEEIARKYSECGVNIFFLQAYGRIYGTHQKYALNLQIASLLPISGLFIKSKDIYELFRQIQPFIVSKITDQNIFKLSKLIALGFRKNNVQQQLLCRYCQQIMIEYMSVKEEDEPQMFQKIRSMWQKITIQSLTDKGYEMFSKLPAEPRRDQLFTNYYEYIKNKGYGKAAKQIVSRLNEH